jgi:GDP-L-fucose synthase
MRVLLTGATGFLGRQLFGDLSRREHALFVFTSESVNLLDPLSVIKVFLESDPDVIVHAAALCGGIGANMNNSADFFIHNMQMGLNVLNAWRLTRQADGKMKKLLLIGTTCSYAGKLRPPFEERYLLSGYPETTNAPYGIAKRSLYAGAFAIDPTRQYWKYVIPANLFGPGDHYDYHKSHAIAAMIRKIDDTLSFGEKKITIWGDGLVTRDFLYAAHAAEVIGELIDTWDISPRLVNIGTGVEISIRGVLAKLLKIMGGEHLKIHWDLSKPSGQRRRALDVSRIKKFYGALGRKNPITDVLSDPMLLRYTIQDYRERKDIGTL